MAADPILAAEDRLSSLGRTPETALPTHLAWVMEDRDTLLAELSRLKEENERLRANLAVAEKGGDQAFTDALKAYSALAEARRQIAERDEALKPFAAFGVFEAALKERWPEHVQCEDSDPALRWQGGFDLAGPVITHGDFRRAASLLSTEPAGGGEKAAVSPNSDNPPEGYRVLPDGVRCRCMRLWRGASGRHYCRRPSASQHGGGDA